MKYTFVPQGGVHAFPSPLRDELHFRHSPHQYNGERHSELLCQYLELRASPVPDEADPAPDSRLGQIHPQEAHPGTAGRWSAAGIRPHGYPLRSAPVII